MKKKYFMKKVKSFKKKEKTLEDKYATLEDKYAKKKIFGYSKKFCESKAYCNTISVHLLILLGITIITLILIISGLFIYNNQRKMFFNMQYANMESSFNDLLYSFRDDYSNTLKAMEAYTINWFLFYNAFYRNPIDPYDEDPYWSYSMNQINSHVILADEMIRKGYYDQAYLQLLEIKNIWMNIFMRNQDSIYTQ